MVATPRLPVRETIDIDRIFHHPKVPHLEIEESLLQDILFICTTETYFKFGDLTYVQTDPAAICYSPCPSFANFYMSNTFLMFKNERVIF